MKAPLFTVGQPVKLVTDAEVWGERFRGKSGVVEYIEPSYMTGEPNKWLYSVSIDNMPYTMQCGDYAITPATDEGGDA